MDPYGAYTSANSIKVTSLEHGIKDSAWAYGPSTNHRTSKVMISLAVDSIVTDYPGRAQKILLDLGYR